jgi:hypothetical protein
MDLPADKKKAMLDHGETTRINSLLHRISEVKDVDLKKIYKLLTKEIKIKDKRAFLVILASLYLESTHISWDNILKRLHKFNLFTVKQKKIPVKTSAKASANKDRHDEHPGFSELYINIGKDKKVFPQDLVRFIMESMKIGFEDIKGIRIFENYSFFRVPKDIAEKTIILMSLKTFRNKKIRVDHSKQSSK